MVVNIRDYFKKPYRYDSYGQMVFDADNNMVAEVRGWGHLSNVCKSGEEATKAQDNFGEEIATMLNNWGRIKNII